MTTTTRRLAAARRALLALTIAGVAGILGCSEETPPERTTATTTPAAGRPPLAIGMGDQRPGMFSDPRFAKLGFKKARIVVAYDVASVKFEWELMDLWLSEARRAGVEPFVTFGHSRVHHDKLPSVAEFRAAFRAFRKRYPDVRIYGPWNEINHSSQPTHDDPERAAAYYNVVRAECPDCVVVAGDVLDQPGMTRYLKRYRAKIVGEPQAWGMHDYTDVNYFRSSGLRAMLKTVPGEIWLTETGGLVQLGNRLKRDEQRAARAMTFLFKVARATPRVRRVYLYNWQGEEAGARFDSGLIGPDGKARPAFAALKKALAAG
jgi:hypothetical protein